MSDYCTIASTDIVKTSDSMPVRKDYQDQEQSKQVRLQMIWDEKMINADKTSPHEKVAVILLSWDAELDDLHTRDEVARLQQVFQDKYSFTVYNRQINNKKPAQIQVHKYLADFVYEENGERTLLIVYYAGHGFAGDRAGTLKLAGQRVPGKALEYPNKAEVVWLTAEGIIDNTEADVLVIFDCCHAGNLGRGYTQKRWSYRCSEYLGATSANSTTPIPGDNSFTSGLIWALENLSDEPCGFTTSELRRKITKSPGFPEDQVPVLCERNGSASLKHIVISPMSVEPTVSEIEQGKKPDEQSQTIFDYLDLRILMDRSLSEHEVGSMSNFFSDLIRRGDLPARRVALLDTRHTQIVRAAAQKWRNHTKRKEKESSITIPGTTPAQLPSPSPLSSIPREMTSEDYINGTRRWRSDGDEQTIRYHLRLLLLVILRRFWAIVLSFVKKFV